MRVQRLYHCCQNELMIIFIFLPFQLWLQENEATVVICILYYVIADAVKDRYDYVEAYLEKGEKGVQHDYVRHMKFYEQKGFEPCGKAEQHAV